MQFGQVLDVWSRVLNAASPLPQLPAALTGYLRASLCVLPWRDAVLVMAAAGPETAQRGAEEFGVFDAAAPGPGRPAPGGVVRCLNPSRGRGRLFRCRRWTDSRHGSRAAGEPGAAALL